MPASRAEPQEKGIVTHCEIPFDHGGGCFRSVLPQEVGEPAVACGLQDWPTDRDREPPTGRQDPPHLAQSRGGVGEEHERELADDGIERAVGERQVQRIAAAPIDRRLQPPRHGEHVVVEIEAGHRPGGTDAGERAAREDAGAACDVQDPVARPDLRDLGHDGRPLGEQGGNEVSLVGDGGIVRQLPSILLGHVFALRCD